jgi:hypothetical protein
MSELPSWVAVPNLVYRYAELIDRGDFAGLGALFAHASIDNGNEVVSGAADVQAMYERWTRRYPDDGTPHTRHVTTNLILDLDDDGGTATCSSYVTVFQATEGIPLQPIFSNRYEDRFRRVDGVWRFEHRRMCDMRAGNVTEHLLQAWTRSER